MRARHTASRLVQYLLLQALIAILCIFVLVRPLPEPPSNYVVTGFQRQRPRRDPPRDAARFRAHARLDAGPRGLHRTFHLERARG